MHNCRDAKPPQPKHDEHQSDSQLHTTPEHNQRECNSKLSRGRCTTCPELTLRTHLELCRTTSGVSADYAERVLKVPHTTLCRVPGAPSSGDGTGCLKMVEASQCGSPPERTSALIIHSVHYAIECARTLGIKPTLLRPRERGLLLLRLDATTNS